MIQAGVSSPSQRLSHHQFSRRSCGKRRLRPVRPRSGLQKSWGAQDRPFNRLWHGHAPRFAANRLPAGTALYRRDIFFVDNCKRTLADVVADEISDIDANPFPMKRARPPLMAQTPERKGSPQTATCSRREEEVPTTAGTGRPVHRATSGLPGYVNGSLLRAGGVRRSRAPARAIGYRTAKRSRWCQTG